MSMTSQMRLRNNSPRANIPPVDKAYLSERAYRADRLVEKWSRIPEVGVGLKNLDEATARNTAIYLEGQTRVLSRLSEAQLSSAFQGLSPENMLRLVRLVYPNLVRPRFAVEFAMETTKDSIKYIRPVYTRSQTNRDIDRTFDDYNLDGARSPMDPDYRKAMYETSEFRYASELSNAQVIESTVTAGTFWINFAPKTVTGTGALTTTDNGPFVLGYVDGRSAVYATGGTGADMTKPVAVQDKSGRWYYAIQGVEIVNGPQAGTFLLQATGGGSVLTALTAAYPGATGVKAYGAFDSEKDLEGNYLGEVELIMDDYQFVPRPWTLGVTMTQLTQITLDKTFGVDAEEYLLDYGGQEIRRSLDYAAVYDLRRNALRSGINVTFNAEAGAGTNDSYGHTAQLIGQAIEAVGDLIYQKLRRGGVSGIIGGASAVTYLRLNAGFTTKGAQTRNGIYQVGEIYGLPVFKAPDDVVPTDELLTYWKNPENEADVGMAYGVLIPFISTGLLQRKNFYAEAGLATYQDSVTFNHNYYGRIKIQNIRRGY